MGRPDLPDPVRDEDVFFDGPEFHDCETAAHLRACGFCRAVLRTPDIDRMREALDLLLAPGGFFEGHPAYNRWNRVPPRPPQEPPVRRKRWRLWP